MNQPPADTHVDDFRMAVLIPAFNESRHIGEVVRALGEHGYPVLVVDDGSRDQTGEVAASAGAEILRHVLNQGKGRALYHGMKHLAEQGFSLIVTMDADGQHNPDDVERFMDTYKKTRYPVLVGNRMAEVRGMPRIRRITNRFMSSLLSRIMRQYVPDTQCGFRLYETRVTPLLKAKSMRFAAESEVLLNLAEHSIPIGSVRVSTIYGTETSQVHPVADTMRFISMLRDYRREKKMREFKD